MDIESLEFLIRTILEQYFLIFNRIGDYLYSFYFNNSRSILDAIHLGFKGIFNVLLVITIILATFYSVMAISVWWRKARKSTPLEKGGEPMVTIQIPTYNELAALNCAERAIDFDYPKERMQIIIGDDSNDPKVSAEIKKFAQKHKELVLVTRRGNNEGYKPGNLNHMLKYTTGEYIVIFDSDFLPEKDFLRRILRPLVKDKDISVVQARWRISNFNQNLSSILGGTISLICHHIALSFINQVKGNLFLCGSAEAIRKSDLDRLGGWRVGSLTEDIECSFRLHIEGKRLVYLEDVECDCEAPHTFKDLCKQQMRWAYGVISALKVHIFSIFTSRKISKKSILSIFILATGYVFSFLLLALTLTGFLSVISNRPAPIDWAKFLYETARNLLLTSGFLITSVIALVIAKKARHIPKMIVSSLSVGLAVTYYVNIGIFKAIFGRGMQWFMLKKLGNQVRQ